MVETERTVALCPHLRSNETDFGADIPVSTVPAGPFPNGL